jgi:hypothetical protein
VFSMGVGFQELCFGYTANDMAYGITAKRDHWMQRAGPPFYTHSKAEEASSGRPTRNSQKANLLPTHGFLTLWRRSRQF